MSLPKYSEILKTVNASQVENEIFLIQKSLFDLRIKKSTSQGITPHLFIHKKRRLAHLKYYQTSSIINKSEKERLESE